MVMSARDLSAIILGALGGALFILPINSIIIHAWDSLQSTPKVKAASEYDADPDNPNAHAAWESVVTVWHTARKKHIPTCMKRFSGSVCLYCAARLLRNSWLSGGSDTHHAINIFALCLMLFFGLRFVMAWIDVAGKFLAARSAKTKSLLDDQVLDFATNGAKIFLIVVATTVVLENFGVDVNSIIAAVGVSSFAIALALTDYLKNIVGLFILLTDQPFELQDHIKVAGIEGFVTHIKFRFTTIKDFQGVRHTVPNATFITNPVMNFYRQEQSKFNLEWVVDHEASTKNIHELRTAILDYVEGEEKDHKGGWTSVSISFCPDGVQFNGGFSYKAGEGRVKGRTGEADPNWNFYFEKVAMKERVVLFIKDEMTKRGMKFAVPMTPAK